MRRIAALACLLGLAAVPPADAAKRKRASKAKAKATVTKLRGKGHVPARFLERGPVRLVGTAPLPGATTVSDTVVAPLLPDLVREVLATTVGVTAREFSLVLSRDRVAAGAVTVSFSNRGEDPHDLAVLPLDGQGAGGLLPEVSSLQALTRKVTLAAGRYELRCTLPGHAQAGMRATLTSLSPSR